MVDAHYCPACWLEHIRHPCDVEKLELLHGWRSVHPERKKEILLQCKPSVLTEEVLLPLEEVEYDGFGDEFFIQESN